MVATYIDEQGPERDLEAAGTHCSGGPARRLSNTAPSLARRGQGGNIRAARGRRMAAHPVSPAPGAKGKCFHQNPKTSRLSARPSQTTHECTLQPRVGLFVTCLVDLMRPSVGFAAAHLIEKAGCTVVVPVGQTCCGQPAYNAGEQDTARDLALQTMRSFDGCDYVVAPSGSCAAMLRIHYPALFRGRGDIELEMKAFAERVHELTSFLVNVRHMTGTDATFEGRVAHHDACSGLRELGIRSEPRRLLAAVAGLELVEAGEVAPCCGFGGLFSVKYPAISAAVADRKIEDLRAPAPDLVTGGDLGCLMNLAGRLNRSEHPLPCRHVAEVLAGNLDAPPIAWRDAGSPP